MSRIINFDNVRTIQNCSNLCYVNSAINLLYSLVEFREKVYNTNLIPNYVENDQEQNKILYYLKYIFLLMNKDLTPNHDRYDMNDDQIFCSRNCSKTTNNLFYNEIYYPFLILITSEEDKRKLELCIYNSNSLIIIIQKLRFISNQIFSFNKDFFSDISLHIGSITDFFKTCPDFLYNDIQPYIIIGNSATTRYQKSKPQDNFIITRGNDYTYEFIGCINDNGHNSHFWLHIKIDTKFQKIDDIKPTNRELVDSIIGNTTFLLFKKTTYNYVDKYPIKNQIINLANISSNIQSDNSCQVCTAENLPNATVCYMCGSFIDNKINNLNYSIMKKIINYRFNTVICAICGAIKKSTDKLCICTVDFSVVKTIT